MTVSDGSAQDGGWALWDQSAYDGWPSHWPPVPFHIDSESRARFTLIPTPDMGNRMGAVHGGFLASFAEAMLGVFIEPLDRPHSTVTVSLNIDYPAGAQVGVELNGEATLLRETGRMQFVRIDLFQQGQLVLCANGVLRKVPRS